MRRGPISVPTFTTVAVPNTGSLILGENHRRFYVSITNPTTQDMWLMFGSQNAFGEGIYLPANGFAYEIDKNNMWPGDVYAIHNGVGLKNLAVFEGC